MGIARRLTAYALLVAGSLLLTAAVNFGAGALLAARAPALAWIATAAIPSCIAIAGLFALFGGRESLRWPRLQIAQWARVVMVSMLWLLVWLAGSAVAAVVLGHWVTYARGPALVAAFILFGPLGEELLFRGLIFERARSLWPAAAWPAIVVSTAAFSLHHLALHAAPAGLLQAQILFTIPMGLVLAGLREHTGSIWPGLLLHMTTNLPAVLG